MTAIYKKEMRSYFIGPIGYIFLACFLMFSSALFTFFTLYNNTADLTSYFAILLYVFAILIPLLTMRMFSEEKRSKTEQILLTSPVSLYSIVISKFLAAFTIFAGTLLISSLNYIVLFIYGTPNFAIMLSTTLGILLIGAAFIAIGIFVSSCTENQLVSALLTIISIVFSLVLGFVSQYITFTPLRVAVKWISFFDRFYSFTYGNFDISSLIYYVSVSIIFIFLTIRVLEKRRWE